MNVWTTTPLNSGSLVNFSNDRKSWDIESICVDSPKFTNLHQFTIIISSCIISSSAALIVNILVWAGHGTDHLSADLEEHAAGGLGPGKWKTYEQRKLLIYWKGKCMERSAFSMFLIVPEGLVLVDMIWTSERQIVGGFGYMVLHDVTWASARVWPTIETTPTCREFMFLWNGGEKAQSSTLASTVHEAHLWLQTCPSQPSKL